MDVIIRKNVIIVYFVQLIIKYIFNKYFTLLYHQVMINGVMNVTLKVNIGSEFHGILFRIIL